MKDGGHWGPKPPHSAPVKHPPGGAVGTDTLGGAVGHLHEEHPFHVQGEGLQDKQTPKINFPVGKVYKGS